MIKFLSYCKNKKERQTPTEDRKQGNNDSVSPRKNNQNSEKGAQDIIERLELQLLLAVIIFFVSSWALLNKTICDFTDAEPLNSQMGYILVHYVLTLVLCLCLYITHVKGKYIIDKNSNTQNNEKYYDDRAHYFTLFMKSWFIVLGVSLLILILTPVIHWWWCAIGLFAFFVTIFLLTGFKWKTIPLVFCIISFFPLFISTMTLINKQVEIVFDKEYYDIDDKVLITVRSKGYACSQKLVCIAEDNLFQNAAYEVNGNLIAVDASEIKGNAKRVIAVGTLTPASGLKNFLRYPMYKMLNKVDSDYQYDSDYKDLKNEKSIYYSSGIVNILNY